jgi:hypothetical protein
MAALSSLLTALLWGQPCASDGLMHLLDGSLPPVFVDAVLELNDGEVADFDWERLV